MSEYKLMRDRDIIAEDEAALEKKCKTCDNQRMVPSDDPDGDVMNTPCPDCNAFLRITNKHTENMKTIVVKWIKEEQFGISGTVRCSLRPVVSLFFSNVTTNTIQ